ncbi:MAG: CpaD family pilus assembly protein [Proteobacteria bacterium]|nr:CpaD family pilus assembly protein [Pseudomonadota bacterium]
MTERAILTRYFRGHFLALAVVSLVLSACEQPKHVPDYRQAFPLVVSKETVSLPVNFSSGEQGLSGQVALDFERFVVDYHNRGRKALMIETGVGKTARSGAEKARKMLMKAGVSSAEISITRSGPGGGVVLSFAAHKVKVPECGDFSSMMSRNWTNVRSSNFGCAFQRNLGLMVRDPGDLQKAQPVSGADGTKAVNTIDSFRAPAEGGE